MFTTVNSKTMLGDKAYAFGKKLVQVFLPGVSAAYFGLAAVWGLPDVKEVVGTIAVISTFLGVVLHLSSTQYDLSGAAYDGTVKVTPTETGSTVALHVDPADMVNKDSVTLKVTSPEPPALPATPPSS